MTTSATRKTPSSLPVLRLRSPSDVLDAVPYLLGFHPAASIVLIGLSGPRRRVGLTLRCDLPMLLHPDAIAQGAESVDSLVERMAASGATSVVTILYAAAEGMGCAADCRSLAEQVEAALRRTRVECRDLLLVDAGRWWSLTCDNPRCCPVEGTPLPPDPAESRVAAEAVVHGLVARPSREHLQELLAPDRAAAAAVAGAVGWVPTLWPRPDRALVDGELAVAEVVASERPQTWRWLRRALESRARGGPAPSAAEVGTLLTAMRDVHVRDGCLKISSSDREASQGFWSEIVRRAPRGLRAAPATVLGVLAWECGDGAFASMAVDVALDDNPRYRLALMLDQLIRAGVRPEPLSAGLPDYG